MSLPAHLNPFRADRLESLGFCFPDGLSWSVLESRLENLGGWGSIVGPHGTGKTALIEEWVRRLEAQGQAVCRIRLNEDRRAFSLNEWTRIKSAGPETFLLIDGEEQLGEWVWWKLRRIAPHFRKIVTTTHRKGRLPLLFETRIFPGLEEKVLSELVPAEKIEGYRIFLRAALRKRGGNLREALFDLYDLEAGRIDFVSSRPRYDEADRWRGVDGCM